LALVICQTDLHLIVFAEVREGKYGAPFA